MGVHWWVTPSLAATAARLAGNAPQRNFLLLLVVSLLLLLVCVSARAAILIRFLPVFC